MLYKFKELDNIGSVIQYKNPLLYFYGDKRIIKIINLFDNQIVFKTSFEGCQIFIDTINGSIISSTILTGSFKDNNIRVYHKNYFLNNNFGISEIIGEEIIDDKIINSTLLCKHHKTENLALIDLEQNKYVWESDIDFTSSAVNENNKVFLEYYNRLICIARENALELWQKNLEPDFPGKTISRLIGVHKNILLVGIGTDFIIGIDTETGKLIWSINIIPKLYKINPHKGVLFQLSKGYSEYDILTGNKIKGFMDDSILSLDSFMSQRDNYAIAGNHIITTDWRKGKIGAFNTETFRFDWLHEEAGVSFPAGQPIKYFEPFLFVMDSKQTLHIFKKE